MLIERRCYELQPGATADFWKTQSLRPDQGLKPIFDRVVGFFSTAVNGVEQIISLYIYANYADWQTRTQTAYANPLLHPYLQAVRPLIVRQNSTWMCASDHYPAAGFMARLQRYAQQAPENSHLSEWILSLRPGSLPQAQGWVGPEEATVMGMFSSFTGELNQLVVWLDAGKHADLEQNLPGWLKEYVVSIQKHRLVAGPKGDLSPWLERG